MTKYFNIRSNYGVETLDSLSREDFADSKSFRAEIKRLLKEYHIAGINVYLSQRASKK